MESDNLRVPVALDRNLRTTTQIHHGRDDRPAWGPAASRSLWRHHQKPSLRLARCSVELQLCARLFKRDVLRSQHE